MAHEMWHAKQALSSFEYDEDGITVAKTPYYDALFKNYQEAGSDGYFDQAVEREAREFVTNGAISINGDKVNSVETEIDDSFFIENTYIVVKRGKKNYYIGRK